MSEERDIMLISKYAGERFDLVQAGGGNSSVKKQNTMLIKASGYSLSDVTETSGYAVVDNSKVLAIMDDDSLRRIEDKRERHSVSSSKMKETIIGEGLRPSIETFLHALLYKYTLHTHPVCVTAMMCRKNAEEEVASLFANFAFVSYATPGIDLAYSMKDAIEKYKTKHGVLPKITFIENHGFIASGESVYEVIEITETVMEKIEKHLGIDFSKEKAVSKLSSLVNKGKQGELRVVYSSSDSVLEKLLKEERTLFFVKPLVPDSLVYCGMNAVEINEDLDISALEEYEKKYKDSAKVIIYKGGLYIVAKNVKKAVEIEAALKAQILTAKYASKNIKPIDDDELAYLGNWEAEKYRQNI